MLINDRLISISFIQYFVLTHVQKSTVRCHTTFASGSPRLTLRKPCGHIISISFYTIAQLLNPALLRLVAGQNGSTVAQCPCSIRTPSKDSLFLAPCTFESLMNGDKPQVQAYPHALPFE